MTGRAKGSAKGCEGVAKGFAKGSAKALTCKSKGSKGFFYAHAHKEKENQQCLYARGAAQNPFDPFAPQVNPFAHPFAHAFATPSHPFGGA
uniref:hypothetical protein n=1 Tax=Bacteria TaxID=2 RepID=UPI0035DA82DA